MAIAAIGDFFKKFTVRDDDGLYGGEDGSAVLQASYDDDYDFEPVTKKSSSSSAKIMPLPDRNANNIKLHRVKENQWQETAKKAAGDLINGCAVFVNTAKANKDATTRLLDFLGGVAYAVDGKTENLGEYCYLFAPCNYDISGDIYEDLNNYKIDDMFS
ncbi:MAG: cell division protein SepF [Oscillospiraceae bacterium]|nr:cell division protein SepF [Oscillospiraceae bacterium]